MLVMGGYKFNDGRLPGRLLECPVGPDLRFQQARLDCGGGGLIYPARRDMRNHRKRVMGAW